MNKVTPADSLLALFGDLEARVLVDYPYWETTDALPVERRLRDAVPFVVSVTANVPTFAARLSLALGRSCWRKRSESVKSFDEHVVLYEPLKALDAARDYLADPSEANAAEVNRTRTRVTLPSMDWAWIPGVLCRAGEGERACSEWVLRMVVLAIEEATRTLGADRVWEVLRSESISALRPR